MSLCEEAPPMKLRRSACIDTLYLELPFLDRFQAAKEDGFDAVEFWSWADRDLSAVKSASDRAGIPVCGFNGDADLSLIDPAQREAYLAFLHRSLEAARFLGASGVTVHSNGLGPGGVVLAPREDLSHTVKLCSLYAGLAASARLAEEAGVTLYLEPLNISTDHPGNFLRDTQTAAELVRLIGSPRLKGLYDIYHMQLNEGRLCDTIRQYADTGEIAFPRVYKALEAAGYTGLVGYELFPARSTREAVKAILDAG